MDCFEHLHKENTEPLVNVSVSHAQPQVFLWFLQKAGEERWNSRTGLGC